MGAYAGFTPSEAQLAVSEIVVAIVLGTSVVFAYLALRRLRTSTPVSEGDSFVLFKLPSGSVVSIPV